MGLTASVKSHLVAPRALFSQARALVLVSGADSRGWWRPVGFDVYAALTARDIGGGGVGGIQRHGA